MTKREHYSAPDSILNMFNLVNTYHWPITQAPHLRMQQRGKAVDALQLSLLAASKAGLLMLAECHAQSSRTQSH
jgi:hypothetical protein